jgi:prolyl-tRNA synthetase
MTIEEFSSKIETMLLDIQKLLLQKNKSFREEHTYYVDSYDEFKEKIEQGFVFAHWDGTAETAEKIQDECKATIRCFPNGEYIRDVNEK